MQQEFITKLGKARAELTAAQERDLVLRLAKNDVVLHLDAYVTAHRQQIIAALENWWDKYAVSAPTRSKPNVTPRPPQTRQASSRTLAMSEINVRSW